MSVAISSFGQPSTVTVSAFENGGASTVSSFGPKNCLRLRSDAGVWSKSGGSCSLRGIGAKTLLHAKSLKIVQPIEVRFKQVGSDTVVYPNAFLDAYGAPSAADANSDVHAKASTVGTLGLAAASVKNFNGLRLAVNGWAKSCVSLVLSINGTSFQCKPKSFLPSLEKLYGDCRYDSLGQAGNCPPYSNACNPRSSINNQDGVQEACLSLIQDAEIKYIKQTDAGDDQKIQDIVFGVDIVGTIPVGPFLYSTFPSLSSLTENDLQSLPHIRDLSVEWVYDQSPLESWFKSVSCDMHDALACDMSDRYSDAAGLNTLTDGGASRGVDFGSMWESCVTEDSIASAAAKTAGKYVNLLRPYITYMLVEPDERRSAPRPSVTVPSIDFTTYNQDVQIPVNKETGKCSFEYIQTDTMSPLICVSVFESDRDGPGGAIGPRGPRFSRRGEFVAGRRGEMAHDICAPIRFETLKINLTVQNQCLGNFNAGQSSSSYFDMYRTFLKYSKQKISYADWYKYCRLLVFSPMELCGVNPALSSQPVTVNIEFEFERCASETMRSPLDLLAKKGTPYEVKSRSVRGEHKPQNFDCSLWFMNYQAVTLSPGQCGVSRISFSPQEVDQSFSGASKQLETQVLDQFTL